MDIYLLFFLASRNKEQRTIWLLSEGGGGGGGAGGLGAGEFFGSK